MHTIDFIEYQRLLGNICYEIDDSKFLPDRIVALSPNGCISGRMISEYFDVPLTNISWGSDELEREHNCWIAEDALNGQQLLVVIDQTDDDILASFCTDMDLSAGDTAWEYNVRFVTVVSKKGCVVEPDYIGVEVDADTNVILPWNAWWS